MYMKTKLKKRIFFFVKSTGLESRYSTQTSYETTSELKVTLENRCHSGVTVLLYKYYASP